MGISIGGGGGNAPVGGHAGITGTNSTTLVTVLNLTGSGRLTNLAVNVPSSNSAQAQIIVDGVSVVNIPGGSLGSNAWYYVFPLGNNAAFSATMGGGPGTRAASSLSVHFKNSLQIKVAAGGTATQVFAHYAYEL